MWKVRAICGVVLLPTILGCLADVGPADQQLLTAAADLVNIRSIGAGPFQLDADFRAQINIPRDGHLTLKWVAKDLWSLEITMGDYRQLNVRKGDTLYISRNAPFTPLRLSELQGLLDVFSSEADDWQIKKVKHPVQGGIETECMEIRAKSGRHASKSKRELCINEATKQVVTEEVREDDDYRRKEFKDYQPFREHNYPRQLRLLVNGSEALNAKIIALRESTFDQATFVPPAGAIARRQCENMTYPVEVKTPDPAYPRSASQNGMGGTATVALTVLPSGFVDNVQVIGSAGHEMDQVTQEILKTWKFKPAMCGTEPIAYDIRVEMNFRLY